MFFEDHPFQTVQTTHPKLTLTLGGCASFQASKSEGCTTALCAGGFDRDTWWNWVIRRTGHPPNLRSSVLAQGKQEKSSTELFCGGYEIMIYLYICMYVFIYIYMYVCVHIYIYIYIVFFPLPVVPAAR